VNESAALSKIRLADIFDADIDELLAMRSRDFETDETRIYADIMICYLSGDILGLESLVSSEGFRLNCGPVASLCARVRLQIRRCSMDECSMQDLDLLAPIEPLWSGEIHMILSFANETLKREVACRDHSLLAHKAYAAIGAKRKSVRALANYVAAQSRIEPNGHYLPDLHHIYRLAKEAGDVTAMSTALINASREYQRLGAMSLAMKYAERGIVIARRNAGNLCFYLSIAHRAHLFAQMGCFREARWDAEALLSANFPVIQAALECLGRDFPELRNIKVPTDRQISDFEKAVSDSWRERRGEQRTGEVGSLEQRLVNLLSQSPKKKSELISCLYGDRINSASAGNRLDNLLNRIRKRDPRLICFAYGKYRLAEEPFLAKQTNSVASGIPDGE
jgi:hypothetical protein